MKFKDIPQLTRSANYRVNQDWNYLIETIKRYSDKDLCPLDIDPDFQRGHVWTEQQQIAYVEFKLRGGSGSNELQFNCPGWMNDFRGPFVLVDGKQRLTAVMKFLNNELPIFDGHYFKDFEGSVSFNVDFVFHINDLSTMEDVYKWYIELNSGGTPHTKEELDKVKKMLKE